MTNTTAPKLHPFNITVNGSTGIIMAHNINDAINRSNSAIEANRDLDPSFFANLFGTKPAKYDLDDCRLREDLI